MKKKALERIPLRQASEGYGASAWTGQIGTTEYLIIDIPEKSLRIVLSGKEYANCFLQEEGCGQWSGEKLESLRLPEWITMPEREEKLVIRWIREKEHFWQTFGCWEAAVEELEERIRRNRRYREEQLRAERLAERCKAMPAVPEDFPAFTEGCFGPSVLFYHRADRRHAKVFCARCGQTAEYAFRKLDSPRGMLERSWEEPERGQKGICMHCGEEGIYRSDKTNSVYGAHGYAYVIQKYRNGIVLRKFFCERRSAVGRKDEYTQREEGRAFFLPEKNMLDYRYTNNWTGETSWYDHNMPGLANIDWQEGVIWPGSFEELKGTEYQYCGLKEYYGWHNRISPKRYIERFQKAHALEYLVKAHARQLVEHIMVHGAGIIDPNGRDPAAVLKLPPEQAHRFLREHGSARQLDLMQRAAENGWKIDRETEQGLLRSGVEIYRIAIALRFMGARKFLNHLMKYADADDLYSPAAAGRVKAAAVTYTDYLSMRAGMGYDMTDSVILFPRDLHGAHHEMAVQQNEHQAEAEIARKEAAYGKGIRARYEGAMEKYGWQDEEKMIRPAESAGEIVQEGRELHHCVGGDSYLKRHAVGESTILFLRKKSEPEIPYVTVEIIGHRINQWYGAYDKKTDQKENEKWLENYVHILKKRAV